MCKLLRWKKSRKLLSISPKRCHFPNERKNSEELKFATFWFVTCVQPCPSLTHGFPFHNCLPRSVCYGTTSPPAPYLPMCNHIFTHTLSEHISLAHTFLLGCRLLQPPPSLGARHAQGWCLPCCGCACMSEGLCLCMRLSVPLRTFGCPPLCPFLPRAAGAATLTLRQGTGSPQTRRLRGGAGCFAHMC